ncbi:nucleotide pyrophosphohydrolase [Mycoplasmatota bacterium]|nr:nucleotide pyrophosphohydrolase [Mycoplasmatota bacterium]
MTLDELQLLIKTFVETRQIDTSVSNRMLDVLSEAGELSKEVLKSTDYGKKSFELTQAFVEEFGDVFFSLICLANRVDINIEDMIDQALIKYHKRFLEHQHIGSVEKKK